MATEARVNDVIAVLLIVGFACLAIWSKPFAVRAMNAQNRTWGFHFGPREVQGTTWIARFVGLVGVALGLWSLLSPRNG